MSYVQVGPSGASSPRFSPMTQRGLRFKQNMQLNVFLHSRHHGWAVFGLVEFILSYFHSEPDEELCLYGKRGSSESTAIQE